MTHQHKNKPQREKNVKDGKNKQNNNFLKLTNLPGDNTNLIKVYQINISGYILSRIILSILNNCHFAGMGILRKFQQYRRLPQDPPPGPPHHLEEELDRLTGKIVRISPLPLSWRSPGHLLLSGQPPVQDRGSGPGGGPGPRGGVRGMRHQQSQHADPALQPPGQQGGIF